MKTHKEKSYSHHFFLSKICSSDSQDQIDLTQKKILIGRAQHCDITLDHENIGHYHAMIHIGEESITITDLHSHEGIIIGDRYIKEETLFEGDIFRLGPYTFQLGINGNKNATLINQDEHLELIHKKSHTNLQDRSKAMPPPQGLVLIDDEYCDIHFDESKDAPLESNQLDLFDKLKDHYIDINESLEVYSEEDILSYSDKDSIMVTTLVNGLILKTDYVEIKPSSIKISGEDKSSKDTLFIPGLILEETKDLAPFMTITDTITINAPVGFESHTQNQTAQLNDSPLSYYKGSLQIIAEVVKTPPHLKAARFFNYEPEFLKEASKVFGAFFIFMVAILFIDTTIPEPPKKLAIIYKRAKKLKVPSPKTAKLNPDKKDTNTGIKKKESPIKEVKFAKKKSHTKKKTQKVAMKKSQKKPVKKIIAKKPAKAKKAPVKAYKFSSSKFKSLMKTSNFKAVTNNTAKSAQASPSNFNAISGKSASQKSLSSSAPSRLGSDSSGRSSQSSGSQGLSSKRGFNTIEADPKTVVLGSIDPELLRKILQEYIPQFKYCYQQELRLNEKAEGVIDLSFRILGNGNVSKISVTSKRSRFSRQGTKCMASVLKVIKFPIPKGGGVVDVKQPLNFVSERGGY